MIKKKRVGFLVVFLFDASCHAFYENDALYGTSTTNAPFVSFSTPSNAPVSFPSYAFDLQTNKINKFKAYQVAIDKVDGFKLRFMDGSDGIYQSAQPIEPYYLDKAIVYRDGSDWAFCFKGKKYPLSQLSLPTNKAKRTYLDLSFVELNSLPICH